ncbi:MAG: hypothetical protein CVT73_09585 [Alphaproteobacteria bacterium HGW-Alphaproteobacteria-12]|nr:MAG: hypothetical protein CVT73_09585 [Alphaproteobacteria bacterium HGW-Alphaproteobacteria-12]
MIRFAIKSLVVMLLVGHALNLAEPAPVANSSGAAQAYFLPADYSENAVPNARRPDIARALSAATNARVVASGVVSDATGFCGREPLACNSSRELLARTARGFGAMATRIANWAGREDQAETPDSAPDTDDDYHPLKDYRGTYPILPEARPARPESL